MSYTKNEQELEQLIETALNIEEIKAAINTSNIQTDSLVSILKKRQDEIWEKGAKEIETVNILEETLASNKTKLSHLNLLRPKLVGSWTAGLSSGASILALVAAIITVIEFINPSFLSFISPYFVIIIAVILLAAALIVTYRRYRERVDEWQLTYNRESQALGLSVLEERIAEAKKAVKQAIIDKGILPELRTIINMELSPSYDTFLTTLAAPGLAEIFDPEYEIPTESKTKLLRIFNSVTCASVGIAGPRGVGKSTLIWSLCMQSNLEIKRRPVLSIMIPAPVLYDARDFVLHIFSSICQRVLKLKRISGRSPWESLNELRSTPSDSSFFGFLIKIFGFRGLLFISMLLLMLGTLLYVLGLSVVLTQISVGTPSPRGTPSPVGTPSPLPVSEKFINALGIQPGSAFLWGLFLAVLGSLTYVALVLHRRRQRQNKRKQESEREDITSAGPLALEALFWLDKIRFQQSYSSGWSGTLKLPIAFEGAVNTAVSLAQNQMSLPEIINGYRDFLKLAGGEYEVIIGIDELDKLESDEIAQRFLNEIKALFGLANTFYLVSVSESAISSFERRGLPFRDTFDSAFDTIIYVDYLNLEDANRLLRRRVIGLPIPFLCFCYCMSGGLARDLIRICRDLLERVQEKPSENSLSELCTYLIKSDIRSKLRAISIAVKDIKLESKVDQFFDKIRQLELLTNSKHLSLKICSDLFNSAIQNMPEQKELANEQGQLAFLMVELSIYLYYSITLLEIFDEKHDTSVWKAAESSGEFDLLTKARQFFALSPLAAKSIISDFRKIRHMDIPQGM